MSNGILFSRLQPFKLDNTFLQIMEKNRDRVLQSQQVQAQKMAKEREELFSGFGKLKSEGDYLRASIDVVNQAKSAKVDLYNNMKAGKISEEDYILKAAEIDTVPDKTNALYQIANQKIQELSEGDPKLNASNLNKILFALKDVDTKFNPETGDVDVTFDSEQGRITKSGADFMREITSVDTIPDQGDVAKAAVNFGKTFKADLIQEAKTFSSESNQGIEVGTSLDRFNDGFESQFGLKEDGDNPKVLKMETEDVSYEEAYDFLYMSARSQVAEKHLETKKSPPKPSTSASDSFEKDLKKSNLTVLTETGSGNSPVINKVSVNSDGENKDIEGVGAAFSAADSKSRFELPYNSLQGVPEGDTRRFLATQFFIEDGSNDLYVKGIAAPKDILLGGADLSDIAKVGEKTEYIKFNADDFSKFRSQVLAGKTAEEVANFLKKDAQKKKTGDLDNL